LQVAQPGGHGLQICPATSKKFDEQLARHSKFYNFGVAPPQDKHLVEVCVQVKQFPVQGLHVATFKKNPFLHELQLVSELHYTH